MKRWSDRSPLTLIHVGVDTSITSTWPMIESMSPLCPKSSASLPRVSGRFSTCVLHTDFTSSAVIRLHLTFRQLEVDPIVDARSTRHPARAALRPEDPRRSTGVCPAFPIGFRSVSRRFALWPAGVTSGMLPGSFRILSTCPTPQPTLFRVRLCYRLIRLRGAFVALSLRLPPSVAIGTLWTSIRDNRPDS